MASAADYVIVNRMSITGSIGVISSYLEFSGLMEKYGVGYERLVSGERKDLGIPYKKLTGEEKQLFQRKLDRIHQFFIEEIASNRRMEQKEVEKIATGEFFLGVEALSLGLVDALGDQAAVEDYLKQTYGLESVDFVSYQRQRSFWELLAGVFSEASFSIGQGAAATLLQTPQGIFLT